MTDTSTKTERLAQNAVLILVARGAMVLGTPALLGVLAWAATVLIDVRGEMRVVKALQEQQLNNITDRLKAQDRRIDGHDQRLDRLERPFFEPRRNP